MPYIPFRAIVVYFVSRKLLHPKYKYDILSTLFLRPSWKQYCPHGVGCGGLAALMAEHSWKAMQVSFAGSCVIHAAPAMDAYDQR